MRVGRRGNRMRTGSSWGGGTQVAVSDEAVYVADYLRYRVLRLGLSYERTESVAVEVGP
ncbi:MAG: hypothetical protein ACUVWX_12550 [Kiritimatiellia bacterium]